LDEVGGGVGGCLPPHVWFDLACTHPAPCRPGLAPAGTLDRGGFVVALGHVVATMEAALHVFAVTDTFREGCVMCANLGVCHHLGWCGRACVGVG
jgi:hypothetical protein